MLKSNDPTHLPEKINQNVAEPFKSNAKNVRNKMFGKDVRESIAQSIEEAGMAVNEWENAQVALTEEAEVINSRISLDGRRFGTLKKHLDALWLEKANQGETISGVNKLQQLKATNLL